MGVWGEREGQRVKTVGGHLLRYDRVCTRPQATVGSLNGELYRDCIHHTHSKLHTTLSHLESAQFRLKVGKQHQTSTN